MRNRVLRGIIVAGLLLSTVTTGFACGEPISDDSWGIIPRYGQTDTITKDGILIFPTCYGSYIYPEMPGRLYKPGDPDAPKTIQVKKVLDSRDSVTRYEYYFYSMYADPKSTNHVSFTTSVPVPGYSDNKGDRNEVYVNLETSRICPESDWGGTCSGFFFR